MLGKYETTLQAIPEEHDYVNVAGIDEVPEFSLQEVDDEEAASGVDIDMDDPAPVTDYNTVDGRVLAINKLVSSSKHEKFTRIERLLADLPVDLRDPETGAPLIFDPISWTHVDSHKGTVIYNRASLLYLCKCELDVIAERSQVIKCDLISIEIDIKKIEGVIGVMYGALSELSDSTHLSRVRNMGAEQDSSVLEHADITQRISILTSDIAHMKKNIETLQAELSALSELESNLNTFKNGIIVPSTFEMAYDRLDACKQYIESHGSDMDAFVRYYMRYCDPNEFAYLKSTLPGPVSSYRYKIENQNRKKSFVIDNMHPYAIFDIFTLIDESLFYDYSEIFLLLGIGLFFSAIYMWALLHHQANLSAVQADNQLLDDFLGASYLVDIEYRGGCRIKTYRWQSFSFFDNHIRDKLVEPTVYGECGGYSSHRVSYKSRGWLEPDFFDAVTFKMVWPAMLTLIPVLIIAEPGAVLLVYAYSKDILCDQAYTLCDRLCTFAIFTLLGLIPAALITALFYTLLFMPQLAMLKEKNENYYGRYRNYFLRNSLDIWKEIAQNAAVYTEELYPNGTSHIIMGRPFEEFRIQPIAFPLSQQLQITDEYSPGLECMTVLLVRHLTVVSAVILIQYIDLLLTKCHLKKKTAPSNVTVLYRKMIEGTAKNLLDEISSASNNINNQTRSLTDRWGLSFFSRRHSDAEEVVRTAGVVNPAYEVFTI